MPVIKRTVLICVLGMFIFLCGCGNGNLYDQIIDASGTDSFRIDRIEEMEADKDPVTVDITAEDSGYEDLIKEIQNTAVGDKKYEVGMEITDPLYTITVNPEDADTVVTVTFNSSGQVHINNTDTTYTIKGDGNKIYSKLKDMIETIRGR